MNIVGWIVIFCVGMVFGAFLRECGYALAAAVQSYLSKREKHRPECAWINDVKSGQTPPGQTVWGELNYLWCQEFCHVKPSEKKK
jgi:hypothetical protein